MSDQSKARLYPPPADAKEWTCDVCGMDVLYCGHGRPTPTGPSVVGHRTVAERVQLPPLPTILTSRHGTTIDIADVSDDDLSKLGLLWTEALIAHARTRRADTAKGQAK